jgi:hypothetical protein
MVRPAADLDLLDLEVVALDGLFLLRLTGRAEVGDVGAHPVGNDHDVRDPAGQLAEDRHQLGGRRPRGHLTQRRVDERLVEHHRAARVDDQGAALERAGLAARVALQQPAADRLHHRIRGALLREALGDAADAQLQLRVGVLGRVRDVGAHRGVGPGGLEHRLQEGDVHDGGELLGRMGRCVPGLGTASLAAYPSTGSSHPVSDGQERVGRTRPRLHQEEP